MIKHILVDSESFRGFEVCNRLPKDNCLSGFSKINLFVGANNSGKSRFLRNLLSNEKLRVVPNFGGLSSEDFPEMKERFESIYGEFTTHETDTTGESITKLVNSLSLTLTDTEYDLRWCRLIDFFIEHLHNLSEGPKELSFTDASRARAQLGSLTDIFHKENTPISRHITWKSLYIPTLRTIRRTGTAPEGAKHPLQSLSSDHYGFTDLNKLFTGEDIYEKIQSLLLGTRSDRKLVREFENFLSRSFFPNQEIELIPRKGKNPDLFVRIGNATEREIYSLGDGIQSIIILTFPLFTKPENRNEFWLVGIEEPELNLHPGFQRLLLQTLSGIPDAQFFITTHSNHLIDVALERNDVSVFKFSAALEDSEADDKGHSVFIQNCPADERQIFDELGVRASSVLLANSTIWVEGISDRRIFKHYLELYQQSQPTRFRQDLHYTFVEYGGSNVTHLSFADDVPDPVNVSRLCSNSLLIADDDNSEGKKRQRLEAFRQKLGDGFIKLSVREVENLITPAVLARVMSESEGRAISEKEFPTDYSRSRIGEVLTQAIGSNAKRKYSDDNGNLLRKADFAGAVVNHTKHIDELSPEAREIAGAIYDFILRCNP